ncbi:MAG: hypothetical protein NTY31_01990 [Candidatus Falkowbacteria bacterium]|nr:hypothetical protein [Candidatus Falkowbacteria bacterium]
MKKSNESPVGKRPFHESIVDAISYCPFSALDVLARLIKSTKIPQNHDAIIEAWKRAMEIINSDDDYGVPESVSGQKPVDYVQLMNSAGSLEEALRLGFDFLPLDGRFLGPQGKILLFRNNLPKGHEEVAEIIVTDAEKNDGKIIFCAAWGKDYKKYELTANSGDKIEDWSDKW